jgi:hypothetical protein
LLQGAVRCPKAPEIGTPTMNGHWIVPFGSLAKVPTPALLCASSTSSCDCTV